nr:hypothetical protein [uncultured Oscillibacter sp.]
MVKLYRIPSSVTIVSAAETPTVSAAITAAVSRILQIQRLIFRSS